MNDPWDLWDHCNPSGINSGKWITLSYAFKLSGYCMATNVYSCKTCCWVLPSKQWVDVTDVAEIH